jgi:hypothetical protein
VAREHCLHLGVVEPGAGDDGMRESGLCDDLLQPSGFADEVLRVPLGLDVHGLDDVVPGRVAQIVARQIAAPQGAVVAVAERDRGLVAQPRQVVALEVPEVLVGVDDGQFSHDAAFLGSLTPDCRNSEIIGAYRAHAKGGDDAQWRTRPGIRLKVTPGERRIAWCATLAETVLVCFGLVVSRHSEMPHLDE